MTHATKEPGLTVIQNRHRRPHVVVVGAGIVGANLALELATHGAEVTILASDADVREGATPNSFAWITNQTFFRAKDPVPEEKARAYFNLHRLSHAAWRRLQLKLQHHLGVRWNGAIQWAYPGQEAEVARIQSELQRKQGWGSPSYAVTGAEIQQLLPAMRLPSDPEIAVFTNDEGIVDPYTAVPKLLEAAKSLGVAVESPCIVETFESAANDRIVVKHSGGETLCDRVVIAAGRATPDLAAEVGVSVPLAESSGDLVHFEPQPELIAPMVMAPDLHALQRPDGRVIVARHYTGVSSGNLDDDGALDLSEVASDATTLFPALKQAKVEKTTRGRRVVPIDGLPIVGQSRSLPGVHVVATNAGISLGPAFGQLVTTEILYDVEVDLLKDYRPERFASVPQ